MYVDVFHLVFTMSLGLGLIHCHQNPRLKTLHEQSFQLFPCALWKVVKLGQLIYPIAERIQGKNAVLHLH